MNAIGDDVVDLGDPETRVGAQHPRFDARVFAPSELEQITAGPDPVRRRWLLWAAKEAAFKVARQTNPRVVFSPRRFAVALGDGGEARVRHDASSFVVRLDARRDLVHAVARPEAASPWNVAGRSEEDAPGERILLAGVASLEAAHPACEGTVRTPDADAPSREARRLVTDAVARRLGVAASRLRVVRRGRVPRLLHGGRLLDAAVSLSHHGRFVGFACLLACREVARGKGAA